MTQNPRMLNTHPLTRDFVGGWRIYLPNRKWASKRHHSVFDSYKKRDKARTTRSLIINKPERHTRKYLLAYILIPCGVVASCDSMLPRNPSATATPENHVHSRHDTRMRYFVGKLVSFLRNLQSHSELREIWLGAVTAHSVSTFGSIMRHTNPTSPSFNGVKPVMTGWKYPRAMQVEN